MSAQITSLGLEVVKLEVGTAPPITVKVTTFEILEQTWPLKVLLTSRRYAVVVETAEGVNVAFVAGIISRNAFVPVLICH